MRQSLPLARESTGIRDMEVKRVGNKTHIRLVPLVATSERDVNGRGHSILRRLTYCHPCPPDRIFEVSAIIRRLSIRIPPVPCVVEALCEGDERGRPINCKNAGL
jgi:hypothetical protein